MTTFQKIKGKQALDKCMEDPKELNPTAYSLNKNGVTIYLPKQEISRTIRDIDMVLRINFYLKPHL